MLKLIVILIALAAMQGALRADFYMDDHMFIVDTHGIGVTGMRWDLFGFTFGSDSPDALVVTVFQLIPTLMTMLTNWLAPANSAVAHVWNLGIHLVLSVLVFTAGRRMLEALALLKSSEIRTRAAFVGALVFACHPLGTEPVHYAKCHMVQLVALFGFWATCEAAVFLKASSKKQAGKVMVLCGLCMLSYFPGTVMLGFNLLALLAYFMWSPGGAGFWHHLNLRGLLETGRGKLWAVLGGGLGASVVAWFLHRYALVLSSSGDLYPVHVVTQGRVFWEYVQRIFVPVGLASDHYQPWSTFKDTAAVLKLAALGLLFVGVAGAAFWKGSSNRRGWALLGLFVLIPFVMRLLYVNIEILVEYRAYNALPWIGLFFGSGLVVLAERIPSVKLRWLPATALITVFTILSVQRGAVWSSRVSLAENVLAQYPENNRARTNLQSAALDEGDYLKVLQLHDEVLASRDRINAINAQNGGRVSIDPIRADSNVIGSYQFAVYARAELEGTLKALQFADAAIDRLKGQLPDSFKTNPDSSRLPAWPVLEARAAVERAHLAGYGQPAPVR